MMPCWHIQNSKHRLHWNLLTSDVQLQLLPVQRQTRQFRQLHYHQLPGLHSIDFDDVALTQMLRCTPASTKWNRNVNNARVQGNSAKLGAASLQHNIIFSQTYGVTNQRFEIKIRKIAMVEERWVSVVCGCEAAGSWDTFAKSSQTHRIWWRASSKRPAYWRFPWIQRSSARSMIHAWSEDNVRADCEFALCGFCSIFWWIGFVFLHFDRQIAVLMWFTCCGSVVVWWVRLETKNAPHSNFEVLTGICKRNQKWEPHKCGNKNRDEVLHPFNTTSYFHKCSVQQIKASKQQPGGSQRLRYFGFRLFVDAGLQSLDAKWSQKHHTWWRVSN